MRVFILQGIAHGVPSDSILLMRIHTKLFETYLHHLLISSLDGVHERVAAAICSLSKQGFIEPLILQQLYDVLQVINFA